MARHIVGAKAQELRQLREDVRRMLKENGPPPAAETLGRRRRARAGARLQGPARLDACSPSTRWSRRSTRSRPARGARNRCGGLIGMYPGISNQRPACAAFQGASAGAVHGHRRAPMPLATGFQSGEVAGKSDIADPDGGLRIADALGREHHRSRSRRRRTRRIIRAVTAVLAIEFELATLQLALRRGDLELLNLIRDDQLDLGDVARQIAVRRSVTAFLVGQACSCRRLGAGKARSNVPIRSPSR